MTYFHGGVAGLQVGDRLVPSPPHVEDGCPICVARAAGRTCTVGEVRRWLRWFGDAALPTLRQLAGAPDGAPIDPPSAEACVYVTTSLDYATWYAARSRGDLYEVAPAGELRPSLEDHFPSRIADEARVVRVLRRGVQLVRRERRRLDRAWQKADRLTERATTP